MKKKLFLVSIVLILGIASTTMYLKHKSKAKVSLNNKTITNKNINTSKENLNNDVSSQESVGNKDNTTTSFNYADYFGEWTIKKSIGSIPVSQMSNNDASGYIGKKIAISSTQFNDVDNIVIKSPIYEQRNISNKDFFAASQRELNYIGVNLDSINEIQIISNGSLYSTSKHVNV